ncbi:class I SAM-dependent DNA methyltransferase [Kiloniella sp. b19]|uniref:class I SAM-dependent DNA methyltransferase n=1 Tax=Kiloniella sp. GXU_MW_B19 TaxID=3141326 RepID=UPI0031DF53A5
MSFEDVYNRWAEDYMHFFYDRPEDAVEEARNSFGKVVKSYQPGGKLLEVGCGTGAYLKAFADLGYATSGADLSEKSLSVAADLLKGWDIRSDLFRFDLLQDQYDGQYDAVIAVGSLLAHFLEEGQQKEAVGKLLDLTSEGGLLLISLYDFEAMMAEEPDDFLYSSHQLGSAGNGNRRTCLSRRCWTQDPVSGLRNPVHTRFFELQPESGETKRISMQNRALTHRELEEILRDFGVQGFDWLWPEDSGYHQPLCLIRKPFAGKNAAAGERPGGKRKQLLERQVPSRRKSLVFWDGSKESTDYLERLLTETDDQVFAHHLLREEEQDQRRVLREESDRRVRDLLPILQSRHRPFGFSSSVLDHKGLSWTAPDNMINMYFMTQAALSLELNVLDRILMPLVVPPPSDPEDEKFALELQKRETLSIQKFLMEREEIPQTRFWIRRSAS